MSLIIPDGMQDKTRRTQGEPSYLSNKKDPIDDSMRGDVAKAPAGEPTAAIGAGITQSFNGDGGRALEMAVIAVDLDGRS